MTKHSFGISIEPTWGLRRCIAIAKQAEKLGFSNLWVPDGGPSPHFSDCVVTLSAIASNTLKIKYGSAILNFYTRNPAQIASTFLALSDLGRAKSSGRRQRAVLGLGVGSEYNVAKFGILSRQGIAQQLREAIESIRELFEGKEVSVRTDAFVIERVSLSKQDRIPIFVGSNSPRGLRLAGELADGVILTDRIPSLVEESMKHITLGLGTSSRNRKDFEVVNSVVLSVSEDKSRARNAARPTCAYLVAWLDVATAEKHGIDMEVKKKISELISSGDEASAAKLVDVKMLDLLTVYGTPQECAERCREHFSYGVDQIAFCEPFGPQPEAALTLIARRVIPKI